MLPRQYKFFLTEIFGIKCNHLREVTLIYLSLRLMQNRIQLGMGAAEWDHLTWTIVVDARQCFRTLSDKEDLTTGCFPTLNLGTTRSMVQAHTLLQVQETPAQWMPPSPKWQPARSRTEDLGGTRTGTKRLLGGSTAGGGSEVGQGYQVKRMIPQTQLRITWTSTPCLPS